MYISIITNDYDNIASSNFTDYDNMTLSNCTDNSSICRGRSGGGGGRPYVLR